MKSTKYWWLGAIFVVALFVRVYRLSDVPYGFHVDEVKAGWNAFLILTTGKDDKGNELPLYYDSFGDFRPTGLMYLMLPFLAVLGKTLFAVRLPIAIVGALTVVPIYLLMEEIARNHKIRLALIVALILALNPWHIMASRATSESVVAIHFTLWGIYFFVRLYREARLKHIILSLLFFGLAYFFYHSIRILAPIYILFTIVAYKLLLNKLANKSQWFVFFGLILFSVVIFLSPQSRSRMSQVSILSDFKVLYEVTKMPTEEGPGHVFVARAFHNRLASYIRRFAEEYKDYLSTQFLVGDMARPSRYLSPYTGLLTYIEFILIMAGLFWLSQKKEMLIFVGLLLLSIIPAAVTIEDTPNMQRAAFMMPFLSILTAYGVVSISNLFNGQKWIVLLFGLIFMANFVYFWHMYLTHQRMSIAAYYRNGGSVELVSRLGEISDNYQKVVLTNYPDNLSPWVAFFLDSSSYSNLYYSKEKCPAISIMKERQTPELNTLYVESEGCDFEARQYPNYELTTIETIRRPDGSPPFYLRVLRNK